MTRTMTVLTVRCDTRAVFPTVVVGEPADVVECEVTLTSRGGDLLTLRPASLAGFDPGKQFVVTITPKGEPCGTS